MKILLDISSHGFGHIAQTSPIVNGLNRPGFEWTVRCAAPIGLLKARLSFPFELIHAASDTGILMKNAIEVDIGATERAYAAFHAGWEAKVEKEALWVSSFDLVLSNVSYLPLKAAHLAGVPAAGFCSLNWADLYWHYCKHSRGGDTIHEQILDAYRSASFFRIMPAMPMTDLEQAIAIGPVATIGTDRRDEIRRMLGLKPGVKLGLVSMGGLPFPIPFEAWPDSGNIHWIVPTDTGRSSMTAFEKLGMPFSDALASVDVLVTKPGYGSFAEAGAAGIPVLYVSRGDWPEETCLTVWLRENGRCLELDRAALESGKLDKAVDALLCQPEKPVPQMSGIADAILRIGSLVT